MCWRLHLFLNACLQSLVVVLLMTTVTLIVTIVAYAGPLGLSDSTAIGVCWVIGALAALSIALQIWSVMRVSLARRHLTDLLHEGRQLEVQFGAVEKRTITPQNEQILRGWLARVEMMLLRYLDRSYVLRFRVRGDKPNPEMLWWEFSGPALTLEEFLKELAVR